MEAFATQDRTEHIGVDKEVIAGLRSIKMKQKVSRKEKIAVRTSSVSFDRGVKTESVLRTYTPAGHHVIQHLHENRDYNAALPEPKRSHFRREENPAHHNMFHAYLYYV